ncbi:hypothetical protein SAMN05660463_01547 [Pseudomonas sp. URIL14HWK12:I9]|nr:hypothetical protein F474_03045 [Pseudomonas sp. URIL14HWK12:I12]PVZ24263.1 hypothetical protein F470_02700 [Pseudomonas sp. URIL14HWK12:I10]PVZ33098.1 hypothetical protein F472_02562 [Pseudomonas sp. URIL14HWK12:I11]SNZ10414.1 hypothetical protein SAMN05660463_01547 [Pseudomonas sp. URIL14HWK12:I9]
MSLFRRRPPRPSPLLIPPCKGWKKDLVAPGKHSNTAECEFPHRGVFNMGNQNFIEISRMSLFCRGWLTLCTAPVLILMPLLIYDLIVEWRIFEQEEGLFFFLVIPLIVFLSIPLLRVDLRTPLNEPIRFNRARQKIYAYNFKPRWLPLFSPWPIDIAVYDWSQVRAEFFCYSAGSNYQYGITLSIVKPGTNEVIDRFRMTYNNASEDPWLYVHTYMEKGPDALPPFDTPRDPNELVWYSPFRRWAPKVKWPDDIDLESTTAP